MASSQAPMFPNEFNFGAKWVHNLFEIVPIYVYISRGVPSNQFPARCNSIRASVLFESPDYSHAMIDETLAAVPEPPPQYNNPSSAGVPDLFLDKQFQDLI